MRDPGRDQGRGPGSGPARGPGGDPVPPSLAGAAPEAVADRAVSFGRSAAAYADERPDYPDAAVRWALEPVAERSGPTTGAQAGPGNGPAYGPRVLDLAAGTGKLTEVLLRGGVPAERIVAVEPDPKMRAEFRRRVTGVVSLAGSAEEIPLPDGSVDAIVVGQALHWFDLDRAVPEIRRVLAPGGVLAGLWNLDDDRVPWVAGLQRVTSGNRGIAEWRKMALPGSTRFASVERAEFPHVQRRTVESMAATIGTHSHALIRGDAERVDLLNRVRAYLRCRPETAGGEFDLPIVTAVMRTLP
jgi:SAM-dependent methyltransferase